jgi:hypothetical protein
MKREAGPRGRQRQMSLKPEWEESEPGQQQTGRREEDRGERATARRRREREGDRERERVRE